MTPFLDLPGTLSPDDCAAVIALALAARLRDAGLVGGETRHGIRRADIACWTICPMVAGSWTGCCALLPRPTAKAMPSI